VDIDESEEQNIFDAETPTFKKLEYFIFENTKIEEDAIAQMYFYVVKKLYEKNSQLLITCQEILKISRDKADYRAAHEVVNGWYIESNIESNSKFSILKKLLKAFEMEDDLFIKYAKSNDSKYESNRFTYRKKYWQQLLPLLSNTTLFERVSPTKDHWISTGAGIGGVAYTFVITKTHVRIELAIITSSKEKNKEYFKKLFVNKESIEQSFGDTIVWEELPESKMSRIRYDLQDVNYYDENQWDRMKQFFITFLPKFESAFRPFVKSLK
jgi:hypothetical protein